MKLIHDIGILSVKKNVDENVGFLLTNKQGSYCSFFNAPSSRYQGLFFFDKESMKMYKFIERIKIIGDIIGNKDAANLKNGAYFAERQKGNIIESFFMPSNFNSLCYGLTKENEIELLLDCKETYDNREWGRFYEISKEAYERKSCLIIKFTKKRDEREDTSSGVEEFSLYLAVKSNDKLYEANDKWIKMNYDWDKERNSKPFERYVYNALKLKGSKFVFSMSKNKDDAVKECISVFNNFDKLKNSEKRFFQNFLKNESARRILKNKKIKSEIKIAYINALNSLNNLIVSDKNLDKKYILGKRYIQAYEFSEQNSSHAAGIFAGIPWFFQFWTRDTLISLKALSKINEKFSEAILFDYINDIKSDGRLPNFIERNFSKKKFSFSNTDSHGWLFFRCNEVIKKSSKGNFLKDKIKNSLEESIDGLLKFHTKDNFEINSAKETWMDTEFNSDNRKGIRIEIQALRLNMYKLIFELSQNQKFKALENILKTNIKQNFWNNRILADGINDFTIRPNIFIAAYIYPKILSNEEWEICFGNALKCLWLDWGGLSTIDKSSPLYAEESTGEDLRSYHRGDSWFWINNLAALVLFRSNKDKFSEHINKIVNASTEEILWKGCIGCHSELSSAKELSSKGCFNQAWSNAMFVEMIDEVFQ